MDRAPQPELLLDALDHADGPRTASALVRWIAIERGRHLNASRSTLWLRRLAAAGMAQAVETAPGKDTRWLAA